VLHILCARHGCLDGAAQHGVASTGQKCQGDRALRCATQGDEPHTGVNIAPDRDVGAVLTTNGHRGTWAQSNSDLSARGEWAEHTATRDALNRCTTRTAVDVTCPRTAATSTFPCCTAASTSSVRIKLTVGVAARLGRYQGHRCLIHYDGHFTTGSPRLTSTARRGR
jgi:hypothetical protein